MCRTIGRLKEATQQRRWVAGGGESLDYYMVDRFGLGCGCRVLVLYEEICQRKSGLVYHLPAFR